MSDNPKKPVKKRDLCFDKPDPHFYRGMFHAKTRFTSANTAETTPEIYQFLNKQFTAAGIHPTHNKPFTRDTFKCKVSDSVDAVDSVELYKYYNIGIQTKPYDFLVGGKRVTGLRILVTIS